MKCRMHKINGDRLSILGLGCMRFPKDERETERLVLRAIEMGVNFFDTAYIYGNSEPVLGSILNRNNAREKIKVATKAPPYFLKKYGDFDKYLKKQLDRLKTDYIDYYFIHNITDVNVWQRLAGLGIEQWIDEKKREGKIRNIGFSYHGGKSEFIKIFDAYQWEFCMIQYNYIDENNQAGKSGLIYAADKGVPVIIMEPLRGGLLADKLPQAAIKVFEEAHIKRSPAEWALRWVWNHSEVACVLSGMSSVEMLEENAAAAESADIGAFTAADFQVIEKAKNAVNQNIKVPCTGCGYCMPCPRGVDIPTCFSCYNNTVMEGKARAFFTYVMQTSLKSKPQIASLCNKCGKCETACPQKIEIRRELQNAAKELEHFLFKPITGIARWFMRL